MTHTPFQRRTLLVAGAASILPLAGCSTSSSESLHRYVLVFDENKCVGCGECKRACNETNALPPGRSRVVLQRAGTQERHYIRVSCQQCEEAPCVNVCPTAACHRDPVSGIVTMNPDRCVGCKYCIAACPFNARFMNEETKTAENCDFCAKRKNLAAGELPGCVARCRFGALTFGDVADPKSLVSRLLAAKDTVRVRPWLGTKPRVRYIPISKNGA